MLKKLLLAAFISMSFSHGFAAQIVSAETAAKNAEAGSVKLIDIRRPSEWKQSGVGKPAHKISMHEPGFLEKLSELTAGKKDEAIALICASGVRSSWLSAELEKRGYTNVVNVREGMFGSADGPGWLQRGLPTKQ